MMLCPCGSNTWYAQCCGVYHQGQQPLSAVQLMRSRYSAYVLSLVDYLVSTTLPIQQHSLDQASIDGWSRSSQWLGLTVHQHRVAAHSPDHAWVSFSARWRDAQGEHQHDERSAFVRVSGQWYFIDPNHRLTAGRNDPCPCGRAAKFKKCCASML